MDESNSIQDQLNKKFSELSDEQAEYARNFFIERQDEIKGCANDASSLFNKSCYLINSGSVIAILAYFGATIDTEHPVALKIALIFFLLGLFMNTLYLYLEYDRHAKHHELVDKLVRQFFNDEITYLAAYNQDNEKSHIPDRVEYASVGSFILWVIGVVIMVANI